MNPRGKPERKEGVVERQAPLTSFWVYNVIVLPAPGTQNSFANLSSSAPANYGATQLSIVNMKKNRGKLFENAEDFFLHEGNYVMKLTPQAAIDVCNQLLQRGEMVVKIEGGIWHNPGFESRVDCIWDGIDPPISAAEAAPNNDRAAEFIAEEGNAHSAFILTTAPITGYLHRESELQ